MLADHSLMALTCTMMSTCWPGNRGKAAATAFVDQVRGDCGKPEAAERRATGTAAGDVGRLSDSDCLRDWVTERAKSNTRLAAVADENEDEAGRGVAAADCTTNELDDGSRDSGGNEAVDENEDEVGSCGALAVLRSCSAFSSSSL